MAPADPILGVAVAYTMDPDPRKVKTKRIELFLATPYSVLK